MEASKFLFTVSPSVNVQYVNALDETNFSSGTIPMMPVPYVLTELGLPYGRILITGTARNKAMGKNHQGILQKHNIPSSFIRELPSRIADPLFVAKSSAEASKKSKNDSFVVYSDFVMNGRPVAIPIVIFPEPRNLGNYKIMTIYDKQIQYGSVNIFEEMLKNGSALYARSRKELEEFVLPKNKEKEARQILTSSAGLIPARVSAANLTDYKLLTKAELVNSYEAHSKETIFIFGGSLKGKNSEVEYKTAEAVLKRRGYKVINPFENQIGSALKESAAQANAITWFKSRNNGTMSKEYTPERLASETGKPCIPINNLLPPLAISRKNLEIAKKDAMTLMYEPGGLL